jgi:hypothetical protein
MLAGRSIWHLIIPSVTFIFIGIFSLVYFKLERQEVVVGICLIMFHLVNFKLNNPISSLILGLINIFLMLYVSNCIYNYLDFQNRVDMNTFHQIFMCIGWVNLLLLLHPGIGFAKKKKQGSSF